MPTREAEEAVHAEREASFLLAVPEKRFLRWVAEAFENPFVLAL